MTEDRYVGLPILQDGRTPLGPMLFSAVGKRPKFDVPPLSEHQILALRRCPAQFKETVYITLVRSTLEYAASIWDPHLAKDCDLLEKLQRRSARFVKGQHPVCPRCCMILAGVTLNRPPAGP